MATSASVKFIRALHRRWREADWDEWRWSRLDKTKWKVPFRLLIHPVEEFTALKYEGRGSVGIATLIALLLFLVTVVEYFAYGFVFNLNRPQDFRLMIQFLSSSLLLVLWCIANWALCTLLDGEGKGAEIWIASCYAFFPRALLGIPLVLVSRVLCLEEQAFLVMFEGLLTGWCILLLFIGTMITHQFSFKKTLLSCLLTVVGMVAMVYLALLFMSMFQQMTAFMETVIREAVSRR